MDRIIARLEQLIKYCSSSSSKYSECIYEIDGLALSIAGKNSDIYKISAIIGHNIRLIVICYRKYRAIGVRTCYALPSFYTYDGCS